MIEWKYIIRKREKLRFDFAGKREKKWKGERNLLKQIEKH